MNFPFGTGGMGGKYRRFLSNDPPEMFSDKLFSDKLPPDKVTV
jgi:hypothetical protein